MTRRKLLALPLLAALASAPAAAWGATVRDDAKLFTPEAVSKAVVLLDKAEAASNIPVTVETVAKIEGNIESAALERAKSQKVRGIYVLVTKGKVEVLASPEFSKRIDRTHRIEIRDAFANAAKLEKDADAGLIALAERASAVTKDASKAKAPAQNRRGDVVAPGAGGGGAATSIAPFVKWGLLILGVLLVIRLIGALLAPRRPAGYGPGGPGGPGGGPGYGGAPGGGGFLSGLAGGLGGALLGNWIYNSFGGHSAHASDVHPSDSGTTGGDWGGTSGNDGGDWGGTGGGDWGGGDGGGDWGGGDGGGGDW